jgi:hypothetical protein
MAFLILAVLKAFLIVKNKSLNKGLLNIYSLPLQSFGFILMRCFLSIKFNGMVLNSQLFEMKLLLAFTLIVSFTKSMSAHLD